MINYSKFHFACPPRTGTIWFLKACQLAGLGPGFKEAAHAPFCARASKSVLRVSLVRNPCDWLASCYSIITENGRDVDHLVPFAQLNSSTFDDFVYDYLYHFPGFVTKLFLSYKADTYMRIEDMPEAFIELMQSIGVSDTIANMALSLKKQNVSKTIVQWDDRLRERVRVLDRKIFDSFEYY